MHPRNPYRTPIDFTALAEAYHPLQSYLVRTANGGLTLDFSDADAQICLTKALLHRDFGLDVQLTPERLCPPVPNRLNYILWLQDILEATQDDPSGPVLGIDVGTGASAIYPLLGCATDARWAFVATELDLLSLRFARENVARNGSDKPYQGRSQRIEVLQASEGGPLLLPLAAYPDRQFAFSMCNPPFYESAEEIAACAAGKARPAVGARRAGSRGVARNSAAGSRQSTPGRETTPGRSTPSRHTTSGSRQSTPGPELATALAGAPVEMVTPGGEVAFVARMVAESVRYGERCRWYTSMLGKLSSVAEIVRVLKEHRIDNYAITELVQGQTRRWAIGWSFTAVRLPDSLARVSSQALQSVLPLRNEMAQPLPQHIAVDTSWSERVEAAVREARGALSGVTVQTNAQTYALTISATANTWSRAARRKAQREASMQPTPDHHDERQLDVMVSWSTRGKEETGSHPDAMDWEGHDDATPGDAAAEYAVEGRRSSTDSAMEVDHPVGAARGPSKHEAASPILRIRWMRGRDRTLFETFWSHLSRKVVGMLV
ncbi:uncharacterized protein SCHCODRAFT_02639553 [Schizophyllum commune H4-8]|uniref:uncharacterized protein n=1 Tax=Schizophyllum commune (strain H4-8 / FGSC 9210) TaxID=578458 RepID=UPI00215E1241|nr:uncharacterized protein SCHCODRAFT_02639553 [Schizophyllum commune H4-8]KAI5888039.1 hypothetical protein SCHCODRAFT_02639553 [Schizophyllum commune H4-8]